MTSLSNATFSIDSEGIIRTWNGPMEPLTGRAASDVLGTPATALQCPGCAIPTCPFAPQDFAQLAGDADKTEDTCLRHVNGTIIDVRKTTRAERDRDGRITGVWVTLSPVEAAAPRP